MTTRSINHFNTLEKENFSLLETNRLDNKDEYTSWQKKVNQHYLSALRENPNWNYRPYQPDFAALYCYRHRNLVGLSMGGGKTIISALVIASVYDPKDDRPGRIHIAVPNHLAARRWIEDLEIIPVLRDRFKYIRSTKELRKTDSPILIYNQDLPKQNKKGRASNTKYIKKHLRPNMLCVDEVHNLKPGTTRTKALTELRLVSKRTLALTGTLSDGDLSYTPFLCWFVYQDYFPYRSPKQFSRHFSIDKKLGTSYDLSDNSNGRYLKHLDLTRLPEYYQLMSRFCHRVSLDDPVVKPYISKPEIDKKVILVDPSNEQLEAHKRYLRQHKDTMRKLADSEDSKEETVLSILHPLIRVANGYGLYTPKLKRTRDEILDSDKTAIFCSTNSGARSIHRFLEGEGITSTRVYASDEEEDPVNLSEERRMKRIDDFLEEGGMDVCILQVNLASESIDLQNAGKVIFYDLPWSSIKVEQAIARTVRPGNPREKVEVTFIASKGLIDQHQLNLIESKIELSKLLFDYNVSKGEGKDKETKDVIDDLLENI